MGFIEVYKHPIYFSNNIILSHEPVKEALENPWIYNLHGHLHGTQLSLPNYLNVNIESTQYQPVDLRKIKLSIEKKCKNSRFEPYKTKWYNNWEKRIDL